MRRSDKIASIGLAPFDVAIIGGGITGAGIFLRCCEMGLKTLLLDQGDFAGGTSSRSAKMIHGGLRYLQYMQVKLVKEALEEREHLLTRYPHLVKPLPFLFPVYDSAFGMMKMRLGLTGYDALSKSSLLPKHKKMSKKEVERAYPMLRSDGLKGAVRYYDALTNDARLTNEVIMEGCELGGVALNYLSVEVVETEDGGVRQIECIDQLLDQKVTVQAEHFISATGIWTDEFLSRNAPRERKPVMKPSKGVHLVVRGEGFPKEDVLLIPCPDKRMLWLCPWWDDLLLIGTTDTPYEGDLREPGTTEEDIEYLLKNTNLHLKNRCIERKDVLSVYSGLRPLLNDETEEDTVKISRDYKIWWESKNLLIIAGGKLTSFLSMADKVVEKLRERKPTETSKKSKTTQRQDQLASFEGLDGDGDFERQIRYFARFQHVEHIADVLTRRMTTTYGMNPYNEDLVDRAASVLANELGWDTATKIDRVKAYRTHWEAMQIPAKM